MEAGIISAHQSPSSGSAFLNQPSDRAPAPVIVARADKSRFRGFGRNWNLAGRSAEICKLDWSSQKR